MQLFHTDDLPVSHKNEHPEYEYFRKKSFPLVTLKTPSSASMRFLPGNRPIPIITTRKTKRPSIYSAERACFEPQREKER